MSKIINDGTTEPGLTQDAL